MTRGPRVRPERPARVRPVLRSSAPSTPRAPDPGQLRVLMVTSEWPAPGTPSTTNFIKRQAEFLKRAGVHVDVFAFRGSKNPVNYVSAWTRVWPLLQPSRYDLVHAQFGQSGLLAFPKRLPLVVTYRGSDLLGIVGDGSGRHTMRGRVLQRASRFVGRRADAVIVVSAHMQAQLKTKAPIHVIPSGIDFRLFRPLDRTAARRELGLPLEERLVLFVGRPHQARKRHALARAAVDILNKRLPAQLIVAWGVPHDKIPVYMAAADCLIVTSMQEGSPNVVKEALACDLPVVSVAVGDVPERLKDVAGTEVCADERPETIAAALERVLRHNEGRRIAGRDAVRDLDERLLTERVIEVYRSVLRNRKP